MKVEIVAAYRQLMVAAVAKPVAAVAKPVAKPMVVPTKTKKEARPIVGIWAVPIAIAVVPAVVTMAMAPEVDLFNLSRGI